MNIINADDPQTFRTEVLDADVPVVVDFWAEWCGPCRTVGPELEALADQYGGAIKVVKVNVDRNPSTAGEYRVRSIPMMGLFEHGDLTSTVVGARPRDAIADGLGLHRFAAASSPAAAMVEAPVPAVEMGADGRY